MTDTDQQDGDGLPLDVRIQTARYALFRLLRANAPHSRLREEWSKLETLLDTPTRDAAGGAGRDLSAEDVLDADNEMNILATPKSAPEVDWPQDAPPLLHTELLGPDGMRTPSKAELRQAFFGDEQPAPDAWGRKPVFTSDTNPCVAPHPAPSIMRERFEYDAQPAPDAMRSDDGTYDEGITYAIAQLASLTGATDWQIMDGSESVEGDVRATILNVLKNANLYDEEDGRFATFSAPVPSPDGAGEPDR